MAKTAERILLTSLTLFNQQGEHNVTSVDIALELDISPGNLYYHFKGKDVIVAALFDLYRQQMSRLLAARRDQSLSIDEFFYYLFMILEKNSLFHFLFRNPEDICVKYPDIAKPFHALINQQFNMIKQCLEDFAQQQILSADTLQRQQLAELMCLVISQASTFWQLKGERHSELDQVYHSLALLLAAGSPYLQIETKELKQLQDAISQQSLSALVDNAWPKDGKD